MDPQPLLRCRRPRSAALPPPLLALAASLAVGSAATAVGAMESPWWENYDHKDRYACGSDGQLVVERNDSQASLISGRGSMILFRETSDAPGLRYRNDDYRLILRGEELTFERLPMRMVCLRMDQV